MKPSDIINTPLEAGQSVMAVMNTDGDKKTIWNRANTVEVEAARKEFKHFKDSGYIAYKVQGEKGERGEVLSEFDPQAERIIFAPPMRGGEW